jgi:uncharacterized protein YdhG (YjbR/CyaY superfamily)
MARTASPIDKHLKQFGGEQLESLIALRDVLREALPDAEEKIAWGMPTFALNGKNVAHFQGFKKHCSYFPGSGGIAATLDTLPDWCEVSKGTIRFPIGKKLPKTLVTKLVKLRLAEMAK